MIRYNSLTQCNVFIKGINMNRKLKIKSFNRFGFKLLLASNMVPMTVFGVHNLPSSKLTNFVESNEFNDEKGN